MHSYATMRKRCAFLCLVTIMFMSSVIAQEYPFDLSENVTATLSVETGKDLKFRNKLTGYNVEGFNTDLQKDFIRKFDPISIRFPHGVWANFYNWKTDGYQKDSYDNEVHQDVLDIYVQVFRGHIDGLAQLNDEKMPRTGEGFNMV